MELIAKRARSGFSKAGCIAANIVRAEELLSSPLTVASNYEIQALLSNLTRSLAIDEQALRGLYLMWMDRLVTEMEGYLRIPNAIWSMGSIFYGNNDWPFQGLHEIELICNEIYHLEMKVASSWPPGRAHFQIQEDCLEIMERYVQILRTVHHLYDVSQWGNAAMSLLAFTPKYTAAIREKMLQLA